MTRFFTSLSTFFDIYGDMFVSSIQKHLFYVLVSVSIGFVLGLFFGILLSRAPQLSAITLPLISVFQTIPGIGPSKAERIIDYRNTAGPFQSIEDIKNVSGIGNKTFESIREYLTVS